MWILPLRKVVALLTEPSPTVLVLRNRQHSVTPTVLGVSRHISYCVDAMGRAAMTSHSIGGY